MGMTEEECTPAMRPASNPLGRSFSPAMIWAASVGNESASFSSARTTVISQESSECVTDPVGLGQCATIGTMGVASAQEVKSLSSGELETHPGTVVLWTNCGRLSENALSTKMNSIDLNMSTHETGSALIITRF